MNNKVSNSEVKEILLNNGVKPSLQRISVLKYILDNKNHPSVDTIFTNLSEVIPTLSRMTVYNTLKLLSQKGLVKSLSISDSELIYDFTNQKPHAHFQCEVCRTIYDIDITENLLDNNDLKGHTVKESQFHLKGICKKCSAAA